MNTLLLLDPRRKTIIEPGKQLILLGTTKAAIIIAEKTRIHGTIVTGYLQSREIVVDAAGIIKRVKAENLFIANRQSKPLIIQEAEAEYTITIGLKAPIIIHSLKTTNLYTVRTLITSLKAEKITINQQTSIKKLEKPPEKIILRTPIARFFQNPKTNKTKIIFRYKPISVSILITDRHEERQHNPTQINRRENTYLNSS